jgi:hypothetical protein
MDEDEAVFAQRVRELTEAQGLNQAELGAKVGIGQAGVFMMLNCACRPQRKTVGGLRRRWGWRRRCCGREAGCARAGKGIFNAEIV